MLRRDLEVAGIPYLDNAGRFLDFHSLRHTFGTNLARAGVAPKVAQELMRHSDVNLTLGIYSHVGISDLAGAVEKLPKNLIERRPETTDAGFSCCKVATQTGNLGNYQGLSDGTDDQSGRLSPLRDGERKPIADKEFTSDKSAHKKEPPMRLELMTYALRKRHREDVSVESSTRYADSDSVVAPMVALGSPDVSCDSVTSGDDLERLIEVLPTDLARVVNAWTRLPASLRQAVLSIVENTSDA